jgi:hypothetical protein
MSIPAYLEMVEAQARDARIDCEVRAAQWLSAANVKREAGKDDSREIRKAQFWLDKYNRLNGAA